MNDKDRDLFARDGHLTMLSVDRYDVGELSASARHVVESHVEGCATCRTRLSAARDPAIALLPPPVAGRSAGSVTIGYLAASAGVAAAASVVLGLFSVLWPDPQTALPAPGEPLHVSGSYTSVAQEIGDAGGPALRVSTRPEGLVVSGIDGSHVAVFAVSSPEEVGDTGGPADPMVLGVVATMPASSDSARISVPTRWAGEDLVVVACPLPLELAVGDTLAVDPGCITSDTVTAVGPASGE